MNSRAYPRTRSTFLSLSRRMNNLATTRTALISSRARSTQVMDTEGGSSLGTAPGGRLDQVAVGVRCDVYMLVARSELVANAGRRDWVPSWKAPRHMSR